MSRRERIEKDGREIEMPPLECGEHLIGYLYEFGPTMAAGMGAGPVTFVEMEAWQRARGINLHPWEARLLRRLSCDYLAESHKATKWDCPAPYMDSPSLKRAMASEVERKMDAFLE
ncbi:hypothetical protein ACQ4WP_27470 [Janthinobacterium sp. GB4P2]|uniref:hypothetical protein n=1 Tax=Janthinobacterium sp. GB4P2 TaxID=3424189 RepID=UPI003F2809B6